MHDLARRFESVTESVKAADPKLSHQAVYMYPTELSDCCQQRIMEQHEHTDVRDFGTDCAPRPQLTKAEICCEQALDPSIIAKTDHAYNFSGLSEHTHCHSHETNSSQLKENSPHMLCRSVEKNEDCAGSMTLREIGQCANCNACEVDCIQCSSCGCDCGGREAYQHSSGRLHTIIPLALTVMSILEQQPNYCPAKLLKHFTDIACMCRDIGRDLGDVVSIVVQELKIKLLGQSDVGTACSDDFVGEATGLQFGAFKHEREDGYGSIESTNSVDSFSKETSEEVLFVCGTANEVKHASKVISADEIRSPEDFSMQNRGFSDGQLGVPASNADTGVQDPDAIIMIEGDSWSPQSVLVGKNTVRGAEKAVKCPKTSKTDACSPDTSVTTSKDSSMMLPEDQNWNPKDTPYRDLCTSLEKNSEEEEEMPGKIFVGNIGYRV